MNDAEILVTDKGKNRFWARFDISGSGDGVGWYSVELTGYGKDEAEARVELRRQATFVIGLLSTDLSTPHTDS